MSFNMLRWSNKSADAQLSLVRKADPVQLKEVARSYDWRLAPEKVMAWVIEQDQIDLGTAITAFFAGDPERFNYIRKQDVPDRYRGITDVLDEICERVNDGFYRFEADSNVDQQKRFNNWLTYQAEDRDEGRAGRWVFDEHVVSALEPRALRALSL